MTCPSETTENAPFDFTAHGCHCPSAPAAEARAAPAPEADHPHGDGHAHGGEQAHAHVHVDLSDRKKLLGALALTCSMMFAEAVGGLMSGSLALLSDAGHMLTDAAALFLAFLAQRFAMRPSDGRRTYGFFRFEILSAFVNALTLIAMAGVISYEAIARLRDPEPIRAGLMLGVATMGLLVNVGGMALLSGSKSLNLRGAFLHVLGDTLSSVGVIAAAIVTGLTGWTLLDPIVSIAIAAIIAVGAVRLLRQAIHILNEGTPEHIDFEQVVEAMLAVEGVEGVHDLHIWTIAQGRNALTAHLVIGADLDSASRDRILVAMREMLSARFQLDHATLQLESPADAHALSLLDAAPLPNG